MADRHDPTLYWPLGKAPSDQGDASIPGGAILQKRGNETEPITLAGNMVLNSNGVWVPVDQSNPLEVRVRELEAKLTALQTAMTDGTQKTQLTGQSVEMRGAEANRPAAAGGNAGYVYWAVDTGDVSVSDGATWRSLGVA